MPHVILVKQPTIAHPIVATAVARMGSVPAARIRSLAGRRAISAATVNALTARIPQIVLPTARQPAAMPRATAAKILQFALPTVTTLAAVIIDAPGQRIHPPVRPNAMTAVVAMDCAPGERT
jgi:hypothetical protein